MSKTGAGLIHAVAARFTVCKNPQVQRPQDRGDDGSNAAAVFLAECVGTRWPGARADEIVPLTGDASSRRYSRARIVATVASAAPESVIIMELRDRAVALASEELGVYGAEGPEELPFVNVWRFLRRLNDAVPDIYAISPDSTVLVLEDIGDLSLWGATTASADGGVELFRRALALAASWQTRARDDGGCYAFRQAFDETLFTWELEHFVEYGLGDLPVGQSTAVRHELAGLARRLAALPRVFCHRDFHAWNIHVQAGGRLRVIDFQDALLGPRLYDVASLLTDRTTPERISAEQERELVLEFAATLGVGVWPDQETVLVEYRLVALQRVLKVIGRFNYLAEVKAKPAYLGMLPVVAATAARLLGELGTFPATVAALREHGKTGKVRVACRQ